MCKTPETSRRAEGEKVNDLELLPTGMIRGIAEGAYRSAQGECRRVTSQRTLKQRVSFKAKRETNSSVH